MPEKVLIDGVEYIPKDDEYTLELEQENAALSDKLDQVSGVAGDLQSKIETLVRMISDQDSEPIPPHPDASFAIIYPGDSLQAFIDDEDLMVLQLKAGSYHQQIDLSVRQNPITIHTYPGDEGKVLINGLTSVDWEWKNEDDTGAQDSLYLAIYPGFDGLFQHVDPASAHNTERAYPLLCTINDDPLMWNADLESLKEGEFHVTSEPDKPGFIYVKLWGDQSIEDFKVSPFPWLLRAHEGIQGVVLHDIYFKGCSNTQFSGALNFPGKNWHVGNVSVRLVNSIGFELGQGAERSNMTSTCYDSTFINCHAYDCGQSGWQGSIKSTTDDVSSSQSEYKSFLIDCGHTRSNWKNYDFAWNAGSKFSQTYDTHFLRFTALSCNGTGLWFDISNERNFIENIFIDGAVRVGLELELSTKNNTVKGGIIQNVVAKDSPDQSQSWWAIKQSAGIVIKGWSDGNTVEGLTINRAEKAVWIDNNDIRNGMNAPSSNNTVKVIAENVEQNYLLVGEPHGNIVEVS